MMAALIALAIFCVVLGVGSFLLFFFAGLVLLMRKKTCAVPVAVDPSVL